jgi:alpha-galactosidase
MLALLAISSSALDNGVSLTPMMGWGTWNLFGCFANEHNWTEVDIRQMADALVSSGLAKCGYKYVNIDGGWLGGRDNKTGSPIPNDKFPSGIMALSDYIHSKGLLFGIYRDRTHGFGYEEADAKQYAAWKVDYVKNDGYGQNTRVVKNLTSSEVYARFRDAVNKTGRPMAQNIKFDIEPDGFEGGPELANSWRVARDMRPVWADVVRQADIASAIGHISRPGAFNDLDALEVGVPGRRFAIPTAKGSKYSFCPGTHKFATFAGDYTMTDTEQRTHFALWSIAASPLILGNDLRVMNASTKAILTSPGPISVNQDPLGVGGRRIRLEPAGLYETWAKPLADGSFAVLLYHRNTSCLANDDSMMHVDPNPQVMWRSLGFKGSATVTDLWTMKTVGTFVRNFPEAYSTPTIPPRGNMFIKVVPTKGSDFGSIENDFDCPVWGCSVQKKVHAAWKRASPQGVL